jgi:hypothetical protein
MIAVSEAADQIDRLILIILTCKMPRGLGCKIAITIVP